MANEYAGAVQELLIENRLPELGPGQPNQPVLPLLEKLTIEKAFAPRAVKDRSLASACLAGLWLYHDFLDQSHGLSQDLHTVEGSYWHGLMHRREPDYDNAKYWFRRVGNHPVFAPLSKEAATLAKKSAAEGAQFLQIQPSWDPLAFIDLCESAALGRFSDVMLCRRIQQREWELLFDYCYRRAH